jgi:hypothetical protein
MERMVVQPSPPLPDASTRPEAHHTVQATYPRLYIAPPRGASNPSQLEVFSPFLLPVRQCEEWREGGGELTEEAPPATKTGALREEEPDPR